MNDGEAAKILGRKGGEALKAKYGIEHFRELGRKGGQKTKENHEPDYYKKINAMSVIVRAQNKGGDAVKKKYGMTYYHDLGKKGAEKRRQNKMKGRSIQDGAIHETPTSNPLQGADGVATHARDTPG